MKNSVLIAIIISLISLNFNNIYGSNGGNMEKAIFAGGCFWCIESAFHNVEGVVEAVSGYTGGKTKNPTYNEVTTGKTGHYESVEVTYNPQKTTYENLLKIFFTYIDPFDAGGQLADRGSHYTPAIFYFNDNQKVSAQALIDLINSSKISKTEVAVQIIRASKFYKAEDYHQDYHLTNSDRYTQYKLFSGRKSLIDTNKKRFKDVFEKFETKTTSQESKSCPISSLNEVSYYVTQQNGTERPFTGKYLDEKRDGIYVDLVSGEPLFSSKSKFDSKTGWPSFTQPIKKENIIYNSDNSHSMQRVEVRSKKGDSHLGHVFDDGPTPEGKRYCINSAALRFIPKEDLEKEGFAELLYLFD